MARRALAPLGVSVVLLKGTAFLAAGLDARRGGRSAILDIWCRAPRSSGRAGADRRRLGADEGGL
jgi:hypothetical protein